MMRDAIEQFRDALRTRGITPPPQIIAGTMQRADVDDKHGKGDASYIYFADGIPAGGFENHKDGREWETWRADVGRTLSLAEQEAQRARIEAAQREREAQQARERAEARERAAAIWKAAAPADDSHPYLIRKGVKAHGLRLHKDALVVPLRDAAGALHSLQYIYANGDKRYLTDGRVTGCYFAIGKPDGRIAICEGYATGASIHEATGMATAIAFDCSNMIHIAKALRAKYPTMTIVIAADDDHRKDGNPGMTAATAAARAVGGLVAVPDFGADRPDGASDFNDLARQRGADAVARDVTDASAPDVTDASAPDVSADRHDEEDVVQDGPPWPDAMDEAALHGIAGEFVRMVEPNTEADPAAILVQFLVAFGALVGRGPHFKVEGDEHHANVYAILVGATAKGRKGTSWSRVREPMEHILEWKPHVSGLSSGEGLKYNVRDAREEMKSNKLGELVMEVTDEGVIDKRLLVVEPEFASALRAAQRQGSTLSATIREGWDSGNLRTLTKHDPVTATGAHISIIGHITADELRAELTETDKANGFCNRFLFVAVRRSKLLPFGGERVDDGELHAMADRLRERMVTARTRHRIGMTADARTVWEKVYEELSEGGGGLHGAVTARAEAQVVRLALLYALLDGAEQIDAPPLLAALAVWQYCDATAKHIFGTSIGDRTADEILRRLQRAGETGVTRTAIRDLFGRNLPAEKIGAALEMLRKKGRVTCETVSTGGRPSEVWRVK